MIYEILAIIFTFLDDFTVLRFQNLPDVDLSRVVIIEILESVISSYDTRFGHVSLIILLTIDLFLLHVITLTIPTNLLIGLVGVLSRFRMIGTQSAGGKEVIHADLYQFIQVINRYL